MNKRNMIAWLIVMQNYDGVISKAPSYIKEKWEKFQEAEYPRKLLCADNQEQYDDYIKKWRI